MSLSFHSRSHSTGLPARWEKFLQTSCAPAPLDFGYKTCFASNCQFVKYVQIHLLSVVTIVYLHVGCDMCPVNTQPFISVLFNEHNGSGALRCLTARHFAADKCFAQSIILIMSIAGIAWQAVGELRCALFKRALLVVKKTRAKCRNEKANIGCCARKKVIITILVYSKIHSDHLKCGCCRNGA